MTKFTAWMQESRRVEAHYGNSWTIGAWLYNAALYVTGKG